MEEPGVGDWTRRRGGQRLLAVATLGSGVASGVAVCALYLFGQQEAALVSLTLAVLWLWTVEALRDSWAQDGQEVPEDELVTPEEFLADPETWDEVAYPTREALLLRLACIYAMVAAAVVTLLLLENPVWAVLPLLLAEVADRAEEPLRTLLPERFFRTPLAPEVRRRWLAAESRVLNVAFVGIGAFLLFRYVA